MNKFTVGSFITVALVFYCILFVSADTPANCSYTDVVGHWQVWLGTTGNSSIDCTTDDQHWQSAVGVTFQSLNTVLTDAGQVGNWSLVYNQAVEWWLDGSDITIPTIW